MDFDVKDSLYIPSKGFAIVIHSASNFSIHIPCSVLLSLGDGTQCEGIIIGSEFGPQKVNDKYAIGLLVKSDMIDNPDSIIISRIKLL